MLSVELRLAQRPLIFELFRFDVFLSRSVVFDLSFVS